MWAKITIRSYAWSFAIQIQIQAVWLGFYMSFFEFESATCSKKRHAKTEHHNKRWIGPLIVDLLDMKLIIKNLLNLSQNIVLTCRSGRRVLVADKILKRKGYLNLRIYSGSFKDWVKNRGTVIKDSQEDLDYFWIGIGIKRYECLFLLSFFNGIKVDQFVFLPIFFANFTIDFCQFSRTVSLIVNVITFNMAFPVVEFSKEGYKIRKVFG